MWIQGGGRELKREDYLVNKHLMATAACVDIPGES